MVFIIEGKVALIFGGASGIGFHNALDLLRNGLRGLTIADVNMNNGQKAVELIENEFGSNKVVFVQTDVTKITDVEKAFEATVRNFNYIDILINSAGILNDVGWENEVLVNVNGVINSMIMGIERYLPQYQQGPEAVVLNMSSLAAVGAFPEYPIYSATKHAVLGLSRSWGLDHFYKKTKVRVVAICPGLTSTPLVEDAFAHTRKGPLYENSEGQYSLQEPSYLATQMVELIKYAPNGTAWVIEGGEPAHQFIFPTVQSMRGNSLHKQ